eukprot:3370968-Prymnesium_polylepis.1
MSTQDIRATQRKAWPPTGLGARERGHWLCTLREKCSCERCDVRAPSCAVGGLETPPTAHRACRARGPPWINHTIGRFAAVGLRADDVKTTPPDLEALRARSRGVLLLSSSRYSTPIGSIGSAKRTQPTSDAKHCMRRCLRAEDARKCLENATSRTPHEPPRSPEAFGRTLSANRLGRSRQPPGRAEDPPPWIARTGYQRAAVRADLQPHTRRRNLAAWTLGPACCSLVGGRRHRVGPVVPVCVWRLPRRPAAPRPASRVQGPSHEPAARTAAAGARTDGTVRTSVPHAPDGDGAARRR